MAERKTKTPETSPASELEQLRDFGWDVPEAVRPLSRAEFERAFLLDRIEADVDQEASAAYQYALRTIRLAYSADKIEAAWRAYEERTHG